MNVLIAITQLLRKGNDNTPRPQQCGKAIETADADIQSFQA